MILNNVESFKKPIMNDVIDSADGNADAIQKQADQSGKGWDASHRPCKGNPLPPRLSISNSASASDASSAFRHIFRLPMHLPPSNASSAFQCVFCLQMRLLLRDLSYTSRPVSCTRLPWYVSSPAAYLVSRFGSSHLPTSRGITRHHATYCDVPQSPRYLAPPASLPLPTRLSRDIPRHPAAPASVAPVPSLGYPTTSRDPVASPAAPCEIHVRFWPAEGRAC